MSLRKVLLQDRRALAALEFALLSPLLVMLFLGTIEVTQLIRVKTRMALAAQAIQNMVAGQSSATQASLDIAYAGGQLVMTPFAGSNLKASIASVTYSSAGAASTVAWQTLEGGATSMSTTTACTLASGLSLDSDSVIIVQATYSYTPILSFLLSSSYTLTQVAYGRPRNATTVTNSSSSTGATGSC